MLLLFVVVVVVDFLLIFWSNSLKLYVVTEVFAVAYWLVNELTEIFSNI